jgi:hypothetical protein
MDISENDVIKFSDMSKNGHRKSEISDMSKNGTIVKKKLPMFSTKVRGKI